MSSNESYANSEIENNAPNSKKTKVSQTEIAKIETQIPPLHVPAQTHKSNGTAEKPRRSSRSSKNGNTQALQRCRTIVNNLMKHRDGWPFNQPVDPVLLRIPDYPSIIKHPMDLGTISQKLAAGKYNDHLEFAADVRLVWSNALTYNQPGSKIALMTIVLRDLFEKKFAPIARKYGQTAGVPTLVHPAPNPRAHVPTTSATTAVATPVSTSRSNTPPTNYQEAGNMDPAQMMKTIDMLHATVESLKRDLARLKNTQSPKRPAAPRRRRGSGNSKLTPMSFEEKKALTQRINKLPAEYLGKLVQIISDSMPELCSDDDELEIDIDSLTTETLRYLERYVNDVFNSHKTKRKRKRGITVTAATLAQAEQAELGTKKQIEEVERQLKELTDRSHRITQRGLARSAGEVPPPLPPRSGTSTADIVEESSSDVVNGANALDDGSASSASDSESSDSDSSDSESSGTESEG